MPAPSSETDLQSPFHHIICQLKTLPGKVRTRSHNRRRRYICIKFHLWSIVLKLKRSICLYLSVILFTAPSNQRNGYFSFSSFPISPIPSPINQAALYFLSTHLALHIALHLALYKATHISIHLANHR